MDTPAIQPTARRQKEETGKEKKRWDWRKLAAFTVLALAVNSLRFWGQYYVFRPDGNINVMGVAYLLVFPFGVALFYGLGALILFLFQRPRFPSFIALLYCVIWIVATFAFMVVGSRYRLEAIKKIPARGDKIVQAIQSYERDNGKAPDTLERLIPKYLTEIPSTGTCNPDFHYSLKAPEGNNWMLYTGFLSYLTDWRVIVYCPSQEYKNMEGPNLVFVTQGWAVMDVLPRDGE